MRRKAMTVDLGPRYCEEFRKYLLGECDFPANAAVWISVTSMKDPQLFSIGPHLHNKTTYHQFEMQIFGVRWSTFVGGQLDPVIRAMCSLRSPENFVYVSTSIEQMAIRGGGHLIETAHIADNVKNKS
jgi:hypothetical protein